MKNRLFTLLSVFLLSFSGWHYNLEEARQIARQQHRYILLNFSGSDWCGPCIQMHKQIFSAPVFQKMADSSLVLVNADFPRMKKNRLTKAQQELNNAMAEQYNPGGKFPLTLLMNADGKILKEWEGFRNAAPEVFIQEVKNSIATQP